MLRAAAAMALGFAGGAYANQIGIVDGLKLKGNEPKVYQMSWQRPVSAQEKRGDATPTYGEPTNMRRQMEDHSRPTAEARARQMSNISLQPEDRVQHPTSPRTAQNRSRRVRETTPVPGRSKSRPNENIDQELKTVPLSLFGFGKKEEPAKEPIKCGNKPPPTCEKPQEQEKKCGQTSAPPPAPAPAPPKCDKPKEPEKKCGQTSAPPPAPPPAPSKCDKPKEPEKKCGQTSVPPSPPPPPPPPTCDKPKEPEKKCGQTSAPPPAPPPTPACNKPKEPENKCGQTCGPPPAPPSNNQCSKCSNQCSKCNVNPSPRGSCGGCGNAPPKPASSCGSCPPNDPPKPPPTSCGSFGEPKVASGCSKCPQNPCGQSKNLSSACNQEATNKCGASNPEPRPSCAAPPGKCERKVCQVKEHPTAPRKRCKPNKAPKEEPKDDAKKTCPSKEQQQQPPKENPAEIGRKCIGSNSGMKLFDDDVDLDEFFVSVDVDLHKFLLLDDEIDEIGSIKAQTKESPIEPKSGFEGEDGHCGENI